MESLVVKIALIVIFALGYALIILEHRFGVNKAGIALLMGVLGWAVLFISHPVPQMIFDLNEHLHDIAQLMIFLIGAMTIVELIDAHRGFRVITDHIAVRQKRPLLAILSILTFFLSAVIDNLTTTIILLSMIRRMIPNKEERLIFAAMIVIAANAGGAWSPIGDVTTTMMWINGNLSTFMIVKKVLFPAVISVLVPLIWFSFHLKNNTLLPAMETPGDMHKEAPRVFFIGIAALLLIPVLKVMTGLPPFMGMMIGLGGMWVLTDLMHQERHYLRVPTILAKIDLSSILFFLGVLLMVAAFQTFGLLNQMAEWLTFKFSDQNAVVMFLGILSALIDNVPLTAAAMGMYPLSAYPMDSPLWIMLAYAVGTGGSLLIIGSAAGVVAMGMERIQFFWYIRRITLPVLFGYLAGILVLILIVK